MKAICDTSAACGRPISEEEQVLSIFAGLRQDFELTIVVLTSRIDSYNAKAASALLLASESRAFQPPTFPESPTANIAMHSKEPWNNTIDTHPLIEVVVDRMG